MRVTGCQRVELRQLRGKEEEGDDDVKTRFDQFQLPTVPVLIHNVYTVHQLYPLFGLEIPPNYSHKLVLQTNHGLNESISV